MTWNVTAQGHHSSDDWVQEEYDLLKRLVKAFEEEHVVTSSFSFSGNHVSAHTLEEAKAKLAVREG